MVSRLLARVGILLTASFLLLAVARCEKRKPSQSPSPSSKTGTNTSTTIGKPPEGWSGETDFANSVFEVIDE